MCPAICWLTASGGLKSATPSGWSVSTTPTTHAGSTLANGVPILASGSVNGIGQRCGGGGRILMSWVSHSRFEWLRLSSTITLSAWCRNDGELPTDVLR